jgi:phenylacetate-CoA ligase
MKDTPFLPDGYENTEELLSLLQTLPEQTFIKKGSERALNLFHLMAERVPAYKDFLANNNLNPMGIQTIDDFQKIPPISKDNYLRQYPREALCWDGKFKNTAWTISTTSGSTGEPFYFPRENGQDLQYALTAELYLRNHFKIHERSTLYIIAFPMGAWIGGLFTYEALERVRNNGNYSLSIITPGINKLEVIKAVKNLGKDFDQVIIGSYAPFLKDILDDGIAQGIEWQDYQLGFIFSAEGFSETFRDYVAKKTGLKNIFVDTLNHYGTVDLGTMSHETPIAILLRRLALSNAKVYELLFSNVNKLPTLTQFNPEMFYFEDNDGKLLCSSFSGYPLVRYDLKDNGGVFTFEETIEKLKNIGVDLLQEAEKVEISKTIWQLPFVYVYERSDFSVSFFAFQIYPETIRKALQVTELEEKLTGKFTMRVLFDEDANQFLEINIELKADIRESEELKQKVQDLIVAHLLQENSEYRKTHEEYKEKTIPHIIFWQYEDPTYFRPGIKQKWVKKD